MRYQAPDSSIIRLLIIGALLTAVCVMVQYSSNILIFSSAYPVEFVRDGDAWIGNVSNLEEGQYFVSVGRPRGLCDLAIDDKLLDSTKSVKEFFRGQLMFGSTFEVDHVGQREAISIRCLRERGFSISLMHPPVVMPYFQGMLLQLWRGFTELILGPFFALFLIITLLVIRLSGHQDISNKFKPYFTFAFIALIYSLSLAYYTRLFLEGLSASTLHIILRMFFQLGFLYVIGVYSRHNVPVLIVGFVLCFIEGLVAVLDPKNLDLIDNIFLTYMPVSTLIYLRIISKMPSSTRIFSFLRLIVISRLILQGIDLSIVWFNVGVYLAPSALALKTTMLLILKFKDDQSRVRQAEASKELLRTLNSNLTIQQMLSEMAKIAFKETSFSRLSAYVDSFTVGRNERPFQKMNRIIEIGYRKDTQADLVVNFDEDRGLRMKEAIDSGKIMMNFGDKDGAHYVNLPLGKHACLNFSNDEPCPIFKAHESFEILTALYPALSSVNERIVNYGMKQGAALQKLRSVRGDGTWQEQIGLIFVDINDYSTLADRYGASFGEFVSAKYLPALCRYVGSWALREFSRGDEVYLVCIKDMLEDRVLPHQAVPAALEKIIEFVSQEGKDLCLSSGFSPLVVSIAAGFGEAAIVCDQMEVRTSGEIINETHRLLSASPVGSIILHKNLVDILSSDGKIYKGSDVPVLVKKNLVLGRLLDRKLSA